MHEPVLTPFFDGPCPRVEVAFPSLPSGVASVTMRAAFGRTWKSVRGGIKIAASGATSRVDFEVPLDTAVTYQAEAFNAAGTSLGFTGTSETFVNAAASDDPFHYLWVHNPLDPSTAVRVALGSDALSRVTRQSDGEILMGEGRRLGMLSARRRGGLVGLPLDVVTTTADDADRFDALFDSGSELMQRMPVLCVRPDASMQFARLPKVFFAAVLSQSYEPDTRMGSEKITWRLTADEVSSPVPALVMPLLRRIDVAAYYATRRAVAEGNDSRFALSRNYEIAGSGG